MINFRHNYKIIFFYTITVIILISLGSWQIYRLKWKNDILSRLKERIECSAIYVSDINNLNIDKFEYRKIKLLGRFLNDKEIHLYGGSRVYKGEPGYFILTPFETSSREYVVINRGWVPNSKKEKVYRPETLWEDQIEIEGYVLKGEQKTRFMPDNNLKNNVWLWIDLNQMKEKTKLDLTNFFILQNYHNNSNQLPLGKNITANIKNNHLTYAITWYMLAIILTIIFYMYSKKQNINN